MVCNSISILETIKEVIGYYALPFSTESVEFHYIFPEIKNWMLIRQKTLTGFYFCIIYSYLNNTLNRLNNNFITNYF